MNNPTAALCHSSDAVFEQVLEDFTTRIQAGELLDLDACVAEHPEYAERLGQLLPAMHVLLAFGASQSVAVDGPAPRDLVPDANGVLGDFRILRELGRGGMGIVYEAEQISIGRPVALKVLPFASMLDERRLARFRNEVRAAGQLHHTNIVPVYAVGSDRGIHFYAMQLVKGQSLAEIIAAMKPGCPLSNVGAAKSASHVPETTAGDTVKAALSTLRSSGSAAFYRYAAQLTVQAAEALEHAHSCGVVHRDIKPSNLLVDERGCLWLTDFGLADIENASDLTMTGDLLGTLRYMSPEQTLGSRVVLDYRTDIYSLGVTLYELLTLRPAFDVADRAELLRQITFMEPTPPRRIDPEIPADLETIVLKAMTKDAGGRYASAQHFADDLRRFLENKPITARRPSVVERGRKWAARHVALVAIAASSFAVVAIVGAAATFFTLRAYRAETQQRLAAEENLAVASQIIDRTLSRAADNKYYQGDLQKAQKLAADATEFYEALLKHNDDFELRFRAAKAHGEVAHIWELVGRHEKAAVANRRAGQLLQRLTTSYPDQSKYLAALAENYNRVGLVDWSLDRPIAAEPAWRQAWEIWNELAERFPQNTSYQIGLAGSLANLGSVCYFSDRFNEAEEYYRRAEAIKAHLPEELKNSASGLASQAGSCTNRAELARLRGQYDRALELLEESIPLHQQSLEKWPKNPVSLDCYFHTHWNIVECNLGANRPVAAAAAVERMVAAFPDRLSAYHEGAVQLLRCVAQMEKPGFKPSKADLREGISDVVAYRQRAHELVAEASQATLRNPDAMVRFAWFLLTSEDESFRDPARALELAKSAVKEVPDRAAAWFTLGLALYRNGDWQAAEEALRTSIQLAPGGAAGGDDALLLAMIRWQQGRPEKARESFDQARAVIERDGLSDEALLRLQAEAAELINSKSNSATLAPQSDSQP